MWEHSRLHHNGERGPHLGLLDFLPSVTGVHNMPLNRTLDEGVRVKNLVDNRKLTCMNSKNEYYRTEYIWLNYSKLVWQEQWIRIIWNGERKEWRVKEIWNVVQEIIFVIFINWVIICLPFELKRMKYIFKGKSAIIIILAVISYLYTSALRTGGGRRLKHDYSSRIEPNCVFVK